MQQPVWGRPHSQLSVQSRGLREFISPTRLGRPWSPDLLWVRVPHVTDHPCLWRNFHSTGWSQPVIATWKKFAAARGDRWTEWMNVSKPTSNQITLFLQRFAESSVCLIYIPQHMSEVCGLIIFSLQRGSFLFETVDGLQFTLVLNSLYNGLHFSRPLDGSDIQIGSDLDNLA